MATRNTNPDLLTIPEVARLWDFIREAYLGTGELLAQCWPLLLVFACILVMGGWLYSVAKSEMDECEEQPDTLSPAKKDALRAWAMRQKMPPNAPEMVALAQEWLDLCREQSEQREHGEK